MHLERRADLKTAQRITCGKISFAAICGAVALIFTLFFSANAGAQLLGKGAVSGNVSDPSGAVVSGADIAVTNVGTGVKVITKTTGSGDYQISLDPGSYTVTVDAQGFKSFVQENVHVNATETVSLDVKLETGLTTEVVTVTDAPPVLETNNATLGATMEQQMYSALPVIQDGGSQRRATDFASLMPGVSAQVTNGNLTTNAGIVNGSGSRGAVSAIYINGVPITSVAGEGDPRFVWTAMTVEAIDQFQVLTNGYPAVYEGQGVQNYIIKSGTNKIHGGIFEFFRNTSLDTWGFLAPASAITDSTGKVIVPAQKPTEHQNEYGIYGGFPLLKDKLFFFGTYDGYRFARLTPAQLMTIPTLAMRQGNFSALSGTNNPSGYINDPDTSTCTSSSCKRNPFASGGTNNVIPASRLSPQAIYMQKFLPNPINSQTSNNYISTFGTGLNNWNTTNRIDYTINSRQNISVVLAWGRQATTAPAAVTVSSTSNGMPPPYISSQQFAPKTKVFLFEHNFIISPRIVNQVKYGYGRYDGPGFNQDISSTFSATAAGITGLPAGQASDSFPTVTFSGNTNINRWAGYSSNRPIASGYVLLDNLQWNVGRHALTFGGEIAWMQYNYLVNATGVNPLQLTFNSSATAAYTANATSTVSSTGNAYASYLIGAVNSGNFTFSAVPETGGRFRPISPYVQDDWKVNSKLTLNLGLRWDYFPSYREVKDRFAYLDPNKTNPLVGVPGALVFGGKVSNGCNCSSPINNYMKNLGPRIGFAFQSSPRTVWRGSYGVIYTHGNDVGGSATSRQGSGLMGYSTSPSTTTSNPAVGKTGLNYWNLASTFPSYTAPPTFDPTLGTYYTTLSSAPNQTMTYADPYYGGRAPQFINWSFGVQQQLTNDMSVNISYVGSQGHFLTPDSLNARGKWTNQLDPKYLGLNSKLSQTATAANLAAAGVSAPYASFGGSGNPTIAQALKPFPQYSGVSDTFGFVGNSNYHALQVSLLQRPAHGLTIMTNYTWSRSIDKNGSFRSGYDIPAAYSIDGKPHAVGSLDRSLSLGDQRHKFVFTGAYDLPFGKGGFGGNSFIIRALAGGWKVSGIYQAYSGSPLGILMNSCFTNPSIPSSTCEPFLNPSYVGNGTQKVAAPRTAANLSTNQYLDPNAFVANSAATQPTYNYMFSTTARTAALPGLFQPGNYKADASLRRSFAIPNKFAEGTKLSFQVDAFNVTNHTHFVYSQSNAVLSNFGTSSYGNLTVDSGQTPRQIQLAGRLEF